ncbi:MAG: ABC transporter permease subunit [Candidatus Thiodiazotropha sp.]
MDKIAALLKSAMPFRMVSDDIFSAITDISILQTYNRGDLLYNIGDDADDIYIVSTGSVLHTLGETSGANEHVKTLHNGSVFGWAAVLDKQNSRLAKAVCQETTELLRINGKALIDLFNNNPDVGDVVMTRFATMINREFTIPERTASRVHSFKQVITATELQPSETTSWSLTLFRLSTWLKSPRPYLMVTGFILVLGFWYIAVEVLKLPRFEDMPGLTEVVNEFISKNPEYGLSIYTPEYYKHIGISLRRIGYAFLLATVLGVPLGLFLGWSKKFREYIFPLFEIFRPIPILAWVPLAIIIFSGSETPVVFLTFLASFFATTLNTMLGVHSIDESYTRAAYCLGANQWQTFREVIVPGAMPYIFTGLQISIGVAWFSLVAGEMVSGQFGLGYVINTSYTMVRYPTIVIGMFTLGVVGYITSTMVRMLGDYMMQWRVRELALGET